MAGPTRNQNFANAYDMEEKEYYNAAEPNDVYCETCGQKLPQRGEPTPPDDSYPAPVYDPRQPSQLPDMSGAKPLQMPR